ncbi:MAG: excinuclease ABC subunit C [Chlamydia sp. 32-24]|nr:MAG: excinuclease ABC subunit C [Chlamydia sp. 32-24]
MSFDTKKIDQFPQQPGVYLMKDKKGEVIYVGKANNLRQRVKQYFFPGRDGRFIVPYLVAKVEDVEIILVSSEKEALLLENIQIKKFKPRYNALLKDDKSYIALKLTTKQMWPRLFLIRYKGKPPADGTYFGPYTSAYSARRTLDLLQRLFPLRQCSDQEFARRTRPCILYDMKRCVAPCVQKCTKQEYDRHVERTVKFLRGHDKEILKELYTEMEVCSEKLEFEKAGDYLRQIREIEQTLESQKIEKPFGGDVDVIGIFREAEEVVLSQLIFKGGKLSGVKHHNFSQIAQDDHELLESFIIQMYELQTEVPHEILVSVKIPESETLSEIISLGKSRKIQIITPQKGEKKSLLEMAYLNAEAAFKQTRDRKSLKEKILLEMEEKFRLNSYPKRIECFDNSNTSGSELVSACVSFIEGEKDTSHYRHYKIKSVDKGDDYGAMYEVLTRRYKRAKEENDLPDLVLIDGGKGHLNIALKVFAELNIITVDLLGVAKEESRHDKGMTSEQIYLPNIKDPVFLRKNSSVLFLIQQIRDEAHRFAITYHRKLREKKTFKSALDDIPSIGPIKKKILLKHFGSVKKIKEATLEELKMAKTISQKNAETIYNFFHSKQDENKIF